MHAIPRNPRPQLGEFVRGIPSRQHVEHALEDAAIQLRERRRPPEEPVEIVYRPSIHRGGRDDLLCEHIERISRVAAGLHASVVHAAHRGRARDEIAAILREDHAFAGGANLMTGPSNPLHPARHGRRGFDLHDQIDGAHVDSELERGGRHQAAELTGFQRVLDCDPLRARQRSVVRPDERFAGQLVQRAGKPLGDAAAVDEDQRGSMRADQLEQARVDCRPDRRTHRALRRRTARELHRAGQPRHVLHWNLDTEVQCLLGARIHDCHGTVGNLESGLGELVVDLSSSLDGCRRSTAEIGGPTGPRPSLVREPSFVLLMVGAALPAWCSRRQGIARPLRAGVASPTARSVGWARWPTPATARARAPGARHAWSAPGRGSRRR